MSLDLPVKDVYKKIWCPDNEVGSGTKIHGGSGECAPENLHRVQCKNIIFLFSLIFRFLSVLFSNNIFPFILFSFTFVSIVYHYRYLIYLFNCCSLSSSVSNVISKKIFNTQFLHCCFSSSILLFLC